MGCLCGVGKMNNQLAFMGKVGSISGFDPDQNTTPILILEALLAAYARITIQLTPNNEHIVMRPIQLTREGTEMGANGRTQKATIKFGRHFILLPAGEMRHDLFQIAFSTKEVDTVRQGRGKQPDTTYKRTVVVNAFKERVLNEVDKRTEVDEYGGRFGDRTADEFGGMKLYYFNIESEASDSTHSKTGWRENGFYAFAIRTISENREDGTSTTWKYLSFFNRPARGGSDMYAINNYLRNLMANNVSTEPIRQRTLDAKTGRMQTIEVEVRNENDEIEFRDKVFSLNTTDSDPVLPEEWSAPPEGASPSDYPIVPSVVFIRGKSHVMTPWAHQYTEYLFDYIEVISNSLVFDISGKVVSVRSVRAQPDYQLVIGRPAGKDDETGQYERADEMIYITTNISKKSDQHKAVIALRDACIARIIFGSSSVWERSRPGKSIVKISGIGNGCLDKTTCQSAIRLSGDVSESESLWNTMTLPSGRNGEYCEMLGHTSEELDLILFPDATFFRSFAGKSMPYADAVAHYMVEVGQSEMIDQMRSDVRAAYAEAFGPYIRSIISNLEASVGTSVGSNNRSLSDNNSINYIPILHERHYLVRKKWADQKDKEKKDTATDDDVTKLVYEFDSTMFAAEAMHNNTIQSYKRVDGGVFVSCPYTAAVSAKDEDLYRQGHISQRENEEIQRRLFHSAYCPYGILAHAFYQAVVFAGNHVDFFPASKLANVKESPINVFVDSSKECTASIASLYATPNSKYYDATPIKYFTDIKKGRDNVGRRKELSLLKEIWTRYIYTFPYLSSLLGLSQEQDSKSKHLTPSEMKANQASNRERILALFLARFLRNRCTMRGNPTPNIYELIPYNTFELDDLQKETAARKEGALEESMKPERRYKNLFTNFCKNCDVEYRAERSWCIQECEKMMSTTSVNEKDFTNLDFVHAFLLSTNFNLDIRVDKVPCYLSREQYLAMSASVHYADSAVNEEMTNLSGTIDRRRAEGGNTIVFKPDQTQTKSAFLMNDMMEVDGQEVDVSTLFDNTGVKRESFIGTTVFANIADVPMFNYDQSFGPNRGQNAMPGIGGSFIGSTLNEALSIGNNFVYMLTRSMHLRDPKSSYEFDFVRGLPQSQTQTTALEGVGTRQYQAPGGAVQMYNSPTVDVARMIEVNRRSQSTSGLDLRHVNIDFVATIRGQIGLNYISKADRCKLIVEFAANSRTSLLNFPPERGRIALRKTLADTLTSFHAQVKPFVAIDKIPEHNDMVEKYTAEDVSNYLAYI